METEFNLSDEIKGFGIHRRKVNRGWIYEEDVKEFIKRLKGIIKKRESKFIEDALPNLTEEQRKL